MKTLYYTVEKDLEFIDGIGETTGYKTINVYEIKESKLLLIANIEDVSLEDESESVTLDYLVEESLILEDETVELVLL